MRKTGLMLVGCGLIFALTACERTPERDRAINEFLWGKGYDQSCSDMYNQTIREGASEARAQQAYEGCRASGRS
ncbi:hypothetical protein [Halocynthiibacter sp.]|uniref:hypothetical protein n=1 Tax=Halocynthiibacter sp. TaxID=1979210 RepID=UPI003C5DC332